MSRRSKRKQRLLEQSETPTPDDNQGIIRSNFGVSESCPYIQGETPAARHQRRYDAAVAAIPVVRSWCEYRNIKLRFVKDSVREFWKWDFRVDGKFAQWLPFVGKFDCKTDLQAKEYHKMKVYGYEQLLLALEWWIGQ